MLFDTLWSDGIQIKYQYTTLQPLKYQYEYRYYFEPPTTRYSLRAILPEIVVAAPNRILFCSPH